MLSARPSSFAPFEAAHFDFESGTLDGWNARRLAGPHSAVVQSEVVRAGTRACRFELRPGDFVSQGHRAELRDPLNAPLETPIWYGFSTLVAPDYPVADGARCVLAQWHDQAVLGDPSGKPPLALRYHRGALVLTGAHDAVATPLPKTRYELARLDDLPRGVWHDFVFRIVWSRFGTSEVEAWMDGRNIVAWTGPLGYRNQAEGPYFKLGVYCSGPIARPHVAFHDNYSRGHSHGEVDPSVLHGIGERSA